ncbi:MAG TPA: pentapeptide repeat-containing protein [Anaerolineales bacterium]|nr:pentapeptide repeat-containing protein [Anaerolineales bacterium]
MEPMSKTNLLSLRKTSFLLFSLPALIWLLMQGYAAAWTGFGEVNLSVKTLWDWMNLLLVPVALTAGVVFLHRSGREDERLRAAQRSALEREIATDRQQEESLQAYFDRMTEFMLKEKLSRFCPEEVRTMARVRTLAVLRGLDAKRKGAVLLFLRDSGLIDREAVIDLCGADLRGASLALANLKRLNLGEADLRNADLRGANLSKAYLSGTNFMSADLTGANLGGADLFSASLNSTDLSMAYLRGATLNGADLRSCKLNEADVRDADLSHVNLNVSDLMGANLRGAKLGKARLLGANLSDADLSEADLSGTEITETEWEKAKSLEGATMPDGTKHA